ncbi:hypothetical protein AcW1_002493 [Taiwanofungus camphoratus]|nr:hypothetical protein AcV7_005446 [Antrodia cinnamomea]KAI0943290.1 hypothetical protein AcW1_002493 [Antrodia cinnamomea]
MGCTIFGQILTATYLLWLTNPLENFRHEQDAVAPASRPILRRVYSALCVLQNHRGVGWNYHVANVPARPSETRWKFVRMRLLRVSRYVFLLDAAATYQRNNPLFSLRGENALSVGAQGYVWRCVNILARFSMPFGMMDMRYSLLSVVLVTLGLSEPKDWPDLYGSWADAYTVRRFWGRTWHQLIRRYVSAYGKCVCRTLRLPSGSWVSSQTQLYIAFIVSGLMHCGGDLMARRDLFGSSFPFFIAQAAAITFEDVIISIARRIGVDEGKSGSLARIVGYVWVFVWFSISAPWYIDWALREGIVHTDVLPFSPIKTLLLVRNVGTTAMTRLALAVPQSMY